MSNQSDENRTGISDEDLPEDLQPSDDNPLAKPLSEEDHPTSPEELDVLSGKTPDESDSETDATDDSEN
ncbi:MAG: hypothetical protein JWN91_3485 [Nocardioides sp.]|jgi:hypothetical protein|nr:hypothetical protein [Nocardioides sp.]